MIFSSQNVYIFAERPLNTEPIEVPGNDREMAEESNPWGMSTLPKTNIAPKNDGFQ